MALYKSTLCHNQACVSSCAHINCGIVGCRWYEHNWRLLSEANALNAYGSIYTLNKKTMSEVIVPNAHKLRYLANEGARPPSCSIYGVLCCAAILQTQLFSNSACQMSKGALLAYAMMLAVLKRCACCTDTMMGQWLTAFNVSFFDDRRMCTSSCVSNSVALQNTRCSGLCDPVAVRFRIRKIHMVQVF